MKIALEINNETYVIITQTQSPLLGEACSAFRRILIMAGYPPEALTVKNKYDE
jgi:hypothetical protein